MSKVLVYGFHNGKLWFGKATFWSWLMAGLKNGRFVKVKPIRNFEKYSYYKNYLFISLDEYNYTNEWYKEVLVKTKNPLEVIAYKEGKTFEEIKAIPSIR